MLVSGWTGIDLSQFPLDHVLSATDSTEENRVHSILEAFTTTTDGSSAWTPRMVAEKASIGGLGPVSVGTAEQVADDLEYWMNEGDLDGFNIGYVTTPGTFEDVVELLIPVLRRRGVYPEPETSDHDGPGLTFRESIYGKGQARLRNDHPGSRYKYDTYREEYATDN